jgi:hypothetical protein
LISCQTQQGCSVLHTQAFFSPVYFSVTRHTFSPLPAFTAGAFCWAIGAAGANAIAAAPSTTAN